MQTQRDMVSTVQGIGASIADISRTIADMSRASKIQYIDDLWVQRYRVALARTATFSQSKKDVHNTFMNKLSEQINEAKREVYDDPTFLLEHKHYHYSTC